VLAGAALAMSLLGAMLVWSATRPRLEAAHIDPQYYLKKHILNLILGLGMSIVVSRIPFRTLRAWSWILYGLTIMGILAALSPLGNSQLGAHAWIVLPAGFAVQPGEFMKITVILVAANLLATKRENETAPGFKQLLEVLAITAVPLGLILLQNDLGTGVMIVFALLSMIVVSGIRARYVIGLVAAGVLGIIIVVQFGLLQQYQIDRFTAFLNPNKNALGIGYNTQQARTAIGSGGFWGEGLFKGNQTNGGFVPEQKTDFVFTVAGEELGFVGSAGIVVLLGIVLWRIIRIGGRSPDLYGRIVAAGVAGWFTFQAFENIGMNLGIMPVTGVPLPFMSYGGSSMFAAWIAIGVLMGIYRARPAVQQMQA